MFPKRFLFTHGLLDQAVHRDAWELTLRLVNVNGAS